jgi:hypothetical protein
MKRKRRIRPARWHGGPMLTSGTSRLALLTVLGALLAAAPAASAATQRYASPTGSGPEPCSSASPCAIEQAVEAAQQGDEVIVAPGDYPLTETVATHAGVTIHGVAGKPRPRLLFSGAGQAGLRVSGSTLRYVEVDQAPGSDASALYAGGGSFVDQVVARAAGAGVTATIQSSTFRNGIAVATGATGVALTTDTSGAVNASIYRNVTAVASGSSGIAIQVRAGFPGGFARADLVNVIARGFVGLEARTDSSGAQATITVTHTNYIAPVTAGTNATIADLGGGNQSLVPTFANWQLGDYRQGPGSPTIGTGLPDAANGELDVEGDPRNLGTVDIGADELVPVPAATTGAAGSVTDHSATLSGTLDGHGGPTGYHFEYGPTTGYGSTTPTTGSGTGTVAAVATLSGLKPATTYHYRLVAANSGGVAKGADRTFTTAPPPQPTPTPPPATPTSTTQTPTATPTAAQAFAGVKLMSTRLTYRRKFITLKLSCPVGTIGRCSGRTKLTARRPASSRTATRVLLGRATFSIAAGTQAKVKVRVSRAGRRLLGAARRLRGQDTNAARDAAGQARTTVTGVTIRRRHR